MAARVRERLTVALSRLFVWLVLRVAYKPPLPGIWYWEVTIPKADLTVECWFVEGDLPGGEWHVVYLLRFDTGEAMLVDSGVGRCWIQPVDNSDKLADRLRYFYKPDYCVVLRVPSTGEALHVTVGPITCVTLAKRLLGVHTPGLLTSRQLLDLLWRSRDGCDKRSG